MYAIYIYSDDLKSIGDDLDDVVTACKIDVIQKVKLKKALRSLPNLPPIIIDKEETMAISQIQKKIQLIQDSIDLVGVTSQRLYI